MYRIEICLEFPRTAPNATLSPHTYIHRMGFVQVMTQIIMQLHLIFTQSQSIRSQRNTVIYRLLSADSLPHLHVTTYLIDILNFNLMANNSMYKCGVYTQHGLFICFINRHLWLFKCRLVISCSKFSQIALQMGDRLQNIQKSTESLAVIIFKVSPKICKW